MGTTCLGGPLLAAPIMSQPASVGEITYLVDDGGHSDHYRRSECRPCDNVGKPVDVDVYPAQRHYERKAAGEYLEVSAARPGRYEHNHKTNGNGSSNGGVTGRKREVRRRDEWFGWPRALIGPLRIPTSGS